MTNYVDILIGATITAFGSAILMIWDYFKIYKESIERETNILNAAEEEMANNFTKANLTLVLINQDLENRKSGKEIVIPLIPFHNEMWALLKINFPKHLSNFIIIKKFGNVSSDIDAINEIIRSRENYRTHNAAMTHYNDRMLIYNSILENKIGSLLFDLMDLNKEFEDKLTIKADEAGAYYE